MLAKLMNRCIVGLMLFSPVLSQAAQEDTMYPDGRVKLQLGVEYQRKDLKTERQIAFAYLRDNAKEFGIQATLKNFKLTEVKESLLGKHYFFQQTHNGYSVRRAGVTISVSLDDKGVYRAYNGSQVINKAPLKNLQMISKSQAFAAAWNDLKVHGSLQAKPKIETAYVRLQTGEIHLVHITYLHVEAPMGAWEHYIDAGTGKVLEAHDTRLERKGVKTPKLRGFYQGKVRNMEKEFKRYFRELDGFTLKRVEKANGSATVFDPDPRTYLNKSDLQDNSPASAFDAAYLRRDLKDITKSGNKYTLKGPWVEIKNFESPATAPSTSTDGNWNFKRGNNAFNDAMTYFHVDQNQRYMQGLGFKGAKSIQAVSIQVDTDGLSGQDNSHYLPGSNQMAFGHGCVDDNEDADVILHEYGHAIHYGINKNWGGGDTGAIGEGFGDYWAGSYSIIGKNGLTYKPNEVFSWDGHGDGNQCWAGRRLNVAHATYDHSKTYSAHSPINSSSGNYISDELWSTPLFQSLILLIKQGAKRSEVDKIILEGHFGLGTGIKMRDLAKSTVAAAKKLYPNGKHAKVFESQFAKHKILLLPQAILAQQKAEVSAEGNNGVVDPGESFEIDYTIKNSGTKDAEGVKAKLSSTNSNVSFTVGSATFPDLKIGASGKNSPSFEVKVDSKVACGTKIPLKLSLNYSGGASSASEIATTIQTGVPQGVSAENNKEANIPDNNNVGVSSKVSFLTGTVSDNMRIQLKVNHTFIGDLTVDLTSPKGTTVTLHNRTGGGNDNIDGTYPVNLTPAQSLAAFKGESYKGDWTLKIRDGATRDTGKLVSWSIKDVSGYKCE